MLLLNRTVQSERESRSVVSDSMQPRGRHGENPWDSLGQNAGVGSLSLLQGIFPAQGWNPEGSCIAGSFFIAEPPEKPKTTF